MRIVAEAPLSEIILRKYELPRNIKEREIVKKICLSLGLLQPGDSRDVVVDLLYVLLKARKRRKLLNVAEIETKVVQSRKLHKITMLGIASSNIRRQIKRLRNLLIVEKLKSSYRITEFMPLDQLFEEKIIDTIIPNISSRISEYCKRADDAFGSTRR